MSSLLEEVVANFKKNDGRKVLVVKAERVNSMEIAQGIEGDGLIPAQFSSQVEKVMKAQSEEMREVIEIGNVEIRSIRSVVIPGYRVILNEYFFC